MQVNFELVQRLHRGHIKESYDSITGTFYCQSIMVIVSEFQVGPQMLEVAPSSETIRMGVTVAQTNQAVDVSRNDTKGTVREKTEETLVIGFHVNFRQKKIWCRYPPLGVQKTPSHPSG